MREVGMARAADPDILAWAAEDGRILLTHDLRTMTAYAHERLRNGQRLVGVVAVPQWMPIGAAVADLEIVLACTRPDELEGQVIHLPL